MMGQRATRAVILVTAVMISTAVVQAGVATTRTVTVPKYTVIAVVLDNTVSSATNRVGDPVQAHCYGANCGGFPAGTTFVGRLTVVQPKQPKAPGKLKAEISSAILPDGTRIAVSALPTDERGIPKAGPTGKSAKPQNRRTGTVAGGAIGAIAGGWAGAIIGTGAGYLVGTAVEGEYTDVTVPAGTTGYITLTAPAKFAVS